MGPAKTGGSGASGATGSTASSAAATAVTGIVVTIDANAVATARWNAVTGSKGYVVARWLVGDSVCCNNFSPPGAPLTTPQWVDTVPLPKFGTYGYRVYATTPTQTLAGDTTFTWNGQINGIPPPASKQPLPVSRPPPGVVVPALAGPGPADKTPQLSSNPPPGQASPPQPAAAPGQAAAPAASTGLCRVPSTVSAQDASAQKAAAPNAPLSGGGGGGALAVPAQSSNSGPGAAEARYCVVLVGAKVGQNTKEQVLWPDGAGDEIYAAAVTVLWDRQSSQEKSRAIVRSVEYGDVGVSLKAANRVRAGSAGNNGGLKTGDVVPDGLVASAQTATPPAGASGSANYFPLLVWEGPLAVGADALLVVPSLWERDTNELSFDTYAGKWRNLTPLVAVLASPAVSAQMPLPVVVAVPGDVPPAPPTLFTLADVAAQVLDRPIGLAGPAPPLTASFRDRFVVITREKLKDLTSVGSSTSLAVTFEETGGNLLLAPLGGSYTLCLRVERTQ